MSLITCSRRHVPLTEARFTVSGNVYSSLTLSQAATRGQARQGSYSQSEAISRLLHDHVPFKYPILEPEVDN